MRIYTISADLTDDDRIELDRTDPAHDGLLPAVTLQVRQSGNQVLVLRMSPLQLDELALEIVAMQHQLDDENKPYATTDPDSIDGI